MQVTFEVLRRSFPPGGFASDASSKPWFGQAWEDKLFAGDLETARLFGERVAAITQRIAG